MTRKIYVLRHGETQFNAEQRLQGHCNSPLTERGQQQALNAGAALAPLVQDRHYHVFCSPLGRAVQTARIVCSEVGYRTERLQQDDRLKEFSLGLWEQRTIPSIKEEHPGLLTERDWYLKAPDAESFAAVKTRLLSWLSELPPSGDLVVVTHALTGAVLRGILLNLSYADTWRQDIPQDAFFMIANGQVERVDYMLAATE